MTAVRDVVINDAEGYRTVTLVFMDGVHQTYSMAAGNFTMVDLKQIDPSTAMLMSEYAEGRISINHIREVLGLDPAPHEVEMVERLDKHLQDYMENLLHETEDGVNEDSSSLIDSLEYLDGSPTIETREVNLDDRFHVDVPQGTRHGFITELIGTLSRTGKSYTINVKGWDENE